MLPRAGGGEHQPTQAPGTNFSTNTTDSTAPSASTTAALSGVTGDATGAHHLNHPGKRKAGSESQDNERLSKRLSLLNLEKNGSKLYVPVETPSSSRSRRASSSKQPSSSPPLNDSMQVDDSKHKVYIYDMDDELSSSDDDTEKAEKGKLVFLPDIEKHLKANRIPPRVLANDDGELAGMQLVLYSDPKSLSVAEDKDSVRKAVVESRRRLRESQKREREGGSPSEADAEKRRESRPGDDGASDAMELD